MPKSGSSLDKFRLRGLSIRASDDSQNVFPVALFNLNPQLVSYWPKFCNLTLICFLQLSTSNSITFKLRERFADKRGFFFISRSSLQVQKLAERMVRWLKVGGHIFFRESCFHQSGDCKRKYNHTHYREPRFYTKVTPKTLADVKGGTLISYERKVQIDKRDAYSPLELVEVQIEWANFVWRYT